MIAAAAWRGLGESRRALPTAWILVDTLAVFAALAVIAALTC